MPHQYTDAELYRLALQQAPHGGESREVHTLRGFVHDEMLAGRIDGSLCDRIGELLDAISASQRPKVGYMINRNAEGVWWDALEVVDAQGDRWRRAFGDDRYVRNEDGSIDRMEEYDWITEGGWCTTAGLLYSAPLRVTRVVRRPAEEG